MLSTRISYEKYLQSDRWRVTRQAFRDLQSQPFRCYCCGAYEGQLHPIEVHHVTYERLGNEMFNDLRLVCRPCHKIIHAQVGMAVGKATEFVRQGFGRRGVTSLKRTEKACEILFDRRFR